MPVVHQAQAWVSDKDNGSRTHQLTAGFTLCDCGRFLTAPPPPQSCLKALPPLPPPLSFERYMGNESSDCYVSPAAKSPQKIQSSSPTPVAR